MVLLQRRARFRLGSSWCFRLAAMTESMTSPHNKHFHPDNDPPLVTPAASSSLVGTIKPWQREQLIGGTSLGPARSNVSVHPGTLA
jgi:hypothetical protein